MNPHPIQSPDGKDRTRRRRAPGSVLARLPLAAGLAMALGFLSLAAAEAPLGPGVPFPVLRGTLLDGRPAELPAAASGRVTLLLMGFSYESRKPVEAWATRVRARFGAEARVTWFQLPMLGGGARLGRWFIESGMRRGTPPAEHDRVLPVYASPDVWKQRLAVTDDRTAWLVLLDPQGRVAWLHHGSPDDPAMESLGREIETLLKPR